MNNCRSLFPIVAFLLFTAYPVVGNIAPPNPAGRGKKLSSITASMRIGPDSQTTEAKLVIPRSVFTQLRAETGSEEIFAAGLSTRSLPPGQTAIAGLFMSLSLVLAGIWFVNNRERHRKLQRVVVAATLVVLLSAAATAIYANAGPPPVARSLTSKILIPEALSYGAYGRVKVEIVEEGSSIQLLLPNKSNVAGAE